MVDLKAIFFDSGGTLESYRYTKELRISRVPLFRECLNDAGICLALNDQELEELISKRVAAYRKWSLTSRIELKTEEIWGKYVFNDLSIDHQALKSISERLSYLYETNFYIREMRPEIPEVLDAVQKMGLKIGCISNTQSLTQVPNTLERYGIKKYFSVIVMSSEYGRRKPDPSIFYHAARLMNLPTGACAYIGDKISRDILGSQQAGFRLAIQIHHEFDDGEKDEGAIPDVYIHRMSDLPRILECEMEKDRNNQKNKETHIKAIFFDAGDILYHRPDKGKNLRQFLKGKDLKSSPNFEVESQRLKDMAFSGKIRRHDYYEQLIRLYGIVDENEIAKGMAAVRQDDETVSIIDEVPETIHILKKKGYILGIITDTAMHIAIKLDWFEQGGFGQVWDVVISSKEIGKRKPDRKMYEEAIAQTGIRPDETVFVGHKASELEGARTVGMKTIAYNYESHAVADAYINNFSELLKLPLIS